MIQQPLAIGGQQIRQQDQPIALGEQREQLREHRRRPNGAVSSATAARLRGDRHRRIEQHLLECRMLFEQVDECGELLLEAARSAFSLTATSNRARA